MSRKERIEAGHSEQPQEPMRRRFIVSDITPEGLSFIHAQNKRELCLWTDEFLAWFKNFNRYNSGSEEQFWLPVFSAKATISDRKGNRNSIFIKRPYISVVGTIQKKILGAHICEMKSGIAEMQTNQDEATEKLLTGLQMKQSIPEVKVTKY